jgi:hypothetical protein
LKEKGFKSNMFSEFARPELNCKQTRPQPKIKKKNKSKITCSYPDGRRCFVVKMVRENENKSRMRCAGRRKKKL